MTNLGRGPARVIAPLAALVALAGCSSAGHPARPASAASPAAASTAMADRAALAQLRRAETVLAGVRSFRFDATQTVAETKPLTTSEAGSVVRAQGVAYTLTVGRVRTQTIRLRAATYVRQVPGKWLRLRKPRPLADPTRTLAAVLRTITALHSAGANTVAAQLPPVAAAAAGIPVGSSPAQVTLTFDRLGHVTRLLVRTATPVQGSDIAVTLVTSYWSFDRVPALRAP